MKSFPSVRIVKVGTAFLLIEEKIEELWLMPDDIISCLGYYELPLSIREIFEEENATE